MDYIQHACKLDNARFDNANLFEVLHPDCRNERLLVCRNLRVARHLRDKLESLEYIASMD